MMMSDKKKIASLIVGGLGGLHQDKPHDKRMEDEQGIKTPTEHKESDDSRMGIEIAMDKFIKAISEKDTKMAINAMMEFQEMSSGMEYYDKSSMHESDEDKGE